MLKSALTAALFSFALPGLSLADGQKMTLKACYDYAQRGVEALVKKDMSAHDLLQHRSGIFDVYYGKSEFDAKSNYSVLYDAGKFGGEPRDKSTNRGLDFESRGKREIGECVVVRGHLELKNRQKVKTNSKNSHPIEVKVIGIASGIVKEISKGKEDSKKITKPYVSVGDFKIETKFKSDDNAYAAAPLNTLRVVPYVKIDDKIRYWGGDPQDRKTGNVVWVAEKDTLVAIVCEGGCLKQASRLSRELKEKAAKTGGRKRVIPKPADPDAKPEKDEQTIVADVKKDAQTAEKPNPSAISVAPVTDTAEIVLSYDNGKSKTISLTDIAAAQACLAGLTQMPTAVNRDHCLHEFLGKGVDITAQKLSTKIVYQLEVTKNTNAILGDITVKLAEPLVKSDKLVKGCSLGIQFISKAGEAQKVLSEHLLTFTPKRDKVTAYNLPAQDALSWGGATLMKPQNRKKLRWDATTIKMLLIDPKTRKPVQDADTSDCEISLGNRKGLTLRFDLAEQEDLAFLDIDSNGNVEISGFRFLSKNRGLHLIVDRTIGPSDDGRWPAAALYPKWAAPDENSDMEEALDILIKGAFTSLEANSSRIDLQIAKGGLGNDGFDRPAPMTRVKLKVNGLARPKDGRLGVDAINFALKDALKNSGDAGKHPDVIVLGRSGFDESKNYCEARLETDGYTGSLILIDFVPSANSHFLEYPAPKDNVPGADADPTKKNADLFPFALCDRAENSAVTHWLLFPDEKRRRGWKSGLEALARDVFFNKELMQ